MALDRLLLDNLNKRARHPGSRWESGTAPPLWWARLCSRKGPPRVRHWSPKALGRRGSAAL